MKTRRPLMNLALLGVLALAAATPALAHGGDGYGPPGYGWGHFRHHREYYRPYGPGAVYYGAPVFVAPPPPPVVVPQPVYYPAPRAYYPRRDPAVVIGIDIPPLVIPLR